MAIIATALGLASWLASKGARGRAPAEQPVQAGATA
jgi:hypothetical protein